MTVECPESRVESKACPSARTEIAIFRTRDLIYIDHIFRAHGMEANPGIVSMKGMLHDERNQFLGVVKNCVPVGWFLLRCRFAGVYEPHVVLSPECRGEFAVEATRQMLGFAFRETDCQSLLALVPRKRRHVIWTAVLAGFQIESRLPAKDGSVVLLTARRPGYG